MRRWRSRSSIIALDRGTRSLRAVQLSFGDSGPGIIHWFNIESSLAALTPEKSEESDAGWEISPAAALDQFDSRRTGLIIGSADVEYCLLTVPEAVWSGTAGDPAEAIRWEVGRQVSQPVDSAEIGVWPLPTPMSSGANAMAVAAPGRSIADTVESLSRNQIDCAQVEPAATALIRACRATAQCSAGEIWGVLDLGFNSFRLYLTVESTPVFARRVRGSGHTWTELIARELRTEYGVAEYHKRKCGIGSDFRGCRTLMENTSQLDEVALPGVLLSVLKGSLAEMVADIERAFRFVMEQYPRRQVGSLVLVGGGARMPGVAGWLSGELGVPVRPAAAEGAVHLAANHPMAQPDVFAVMAGCVGMALGEVES
ncbi:MAG TPA: hypothetical protein VLM89_16100 [Phycisphaerae bacterium]|nr:hypothetical protein [Phycisphaerae bacterium]